MNAGLKKQLISLKDKEIELRQSILSEGTLYDGYDARMESLHIENAEKLDNIISEHGWPGRSLVGREGADAAIMLAQNAISKPALQRRFLEFVRLAVEQGEATAIQMACLQDRILFNEGKPQQFGMLFDWDESGNLFTNVDDVEDANKRRKALGLMTIEEATKKHKQEIEKEGGGPPSDYKKHKAMEAEWAKRVGWR